MCRNKFCPFLCYLNQHFMITMRKKARKFRWCNLFTAHTQFMTMTTKLEKINQKGPSQLFHYRVGKHTWKISQITSTSINQTFLVKVSMTNLVFTLFHSPNSITLLGPLILSAFTSFSLLPLLSLVSLSSLKASRWIFWSNIKSCLLISTSHMKKINFLPPHDGALCRWFGWYTWLLFQQALSGWYGDERWWWCWFKSFFCALSQCWQ